MGGIMYKLVYSTLKPSSASVKGTITMHVRGSSKPVVLEDDFYWIIVTQRSPYNGALTPDSMWVSVMRVRDRFPPWPCSLGFQAPTAFPARSLTLAHLLPWHHHSFRTSLASAE